MRVERGRDFANRPPLSLYGGGEYDDYHYGNPGHGYIRYCMPDATARVEWDSGKEPPSWHRTVYFTGRELDGTKRYDLHIVSDTGKKHYGVK